MAESRLNNRLFMMIIAQAFLESAEPSGGRPRSTLQLNANPISRRLRIPLYGPIYDINIEANLSRSVSN